MKDWEDVIKDRQLSRKAELPESDWNDFLSRQAEHERAVKRRHRLITAAISFPAAAAVLLLLFLIPFKAAAPDNQISQNEPSEPQIATDSLANPTDTIAIEKPKVEIAQVKPQVKPEAKPESKPEEKLKENSEEKSEEKPDVNTVITERYVEPTVYGGSTSQLTDSRLLAQELSVKGSVYDFDSAEPMYPAAVMIYRIDGADSTYVAGTQTNENGEFVIGNLEPGNYVASTRFMGYDDAYKSFTIRPGEEISDIGKITIRGGMMLSEIAVSAVVAKVQMINDTVMFNNAAFKRPEGSSVEDLVRKLPGVEIDSTGNITVNGKSVSRLLVNGKEFFSNDRQEELTQLTADMIEKVKAYEKQSDLSRQTGIDDGREETVLDLPVHGKIIIKGSVWDFDTAEPMENASVQIYRVTRKDSTFICSTLTGQDGSFVIYNLKRGKYVARASFEDYNNGEKSFKVRSGSHINDIGKICVRRTDRMIDIQIPENYTPTVPFPTDSASIMELILKLPGAEMDSAGVIKINGKTVKRVLRVGKETQ